MKVASKSVAQNHTCVVLALLALFAAISPSASANHSTAKPTVQPASVIAHLPLEGAPASQMFLGERGGTQYLYLGQTSSDGMVIVDVTKPSQPSVVKRMAWPMGASTGKLQLVGAGLALTEAPDATAPAPASRSEALTILDLSDPTNPRTILSLSGVTSTLTDDARNLIYITNNDGLWIVKRLPEQASSSEHRGCLSQDAFNEFASCQ